MFGGYSFSVSWSFLLLSACQMSGGAINSRLRLRRLLLQVGREVAILKDLANLDQAPLRQGTPFGPLDGLFLRFHLNDPEAGNQFLCFGKGPVSHGPLAAGHPDARPLGARVEALGRE